jgi:beta-lactamase class A
VTTSRRGRNYRARLVLISFVVVVFGAHAGWNKHVSAQAAAAVQAHQTQRVEATAKAVIFKSQVAELQAANPLITISVAVGSDTLGIESLGDPGAYSAASVGKLITAASYLHLVDTNKTSLNQRIAGKTTRYWLNLMLVQSDDDAWQNLNSYVTHAGLSNYATSIGLTDYDADTDNFPAVDAAILLQKLQTGSLLSSSSQQLMLGWLAVANYRSYIIPAVQAGSTVYHKVGFDGDNLHDTAIIQKGSQRFVLVIFTNGHGNYDWDARARLMQTITRDAQTAYL